MPLYESYGASPLAETYGNLQDITRAALATLGVIYVTPSARQLLKDAGMAPLAMAVAHAHGIWGTGVDAYEAFLNDMALACGGYMRSVYRIEGKADVWLVSQPRDSEGLRPGSLICAAWEFSSGFEERGE